MSWAVASAPPAFNSRFAAAIFESICLIVAPTQDAVRPMTCFGESAARDSYTSPSKSQYRRSVAVRLHLREKTKVRNRPLMGGFLTFLVERGLAAQRTALLLEEGAEHHHASETLAPR